MMRSKAYIKNINKLGLSLILFVMSWPCILTADTPTNDEVFARINDRTILYAEFMEIFRAAKRYKYYHGEVPAEELAKFQRQVGRDIVEQVLLHQQAMKLGLQPDKNKIQAGLKEYDNKNADNPEWQARKDTSLRRMFEMLERKDMIEQMGSRVRNIERPSSLAVETYYQQYPEKFTEPRRVWVSVILLSVPPSSTDQTWLDAEKTANQFIQRIQQGEAFEDLARAYSAHLSAANGGDLGYLHQGMLEGDANTAVNKLEVNQISAPVQVLEGITIFRLNAIQAEKLKPFNEVKQRASELLYRELQDKAWDEYLSNLTRTADIYINENLYAPADE
jgi:parvulin-like peptidyl-prolyl isomerase